jgi:hypothetical protein
MNYIYPAAKEVVVWLGYIEEERESNAQEIESMAVSLLEELSAEEIRTFDTFLEIAQRGEQPELRWKALSSILQHPWLTRLWTHQELILATSASFVTDYHVLQFNRFLLAATIIHRASDQIPFKRLPPFLGEIFADHRGFMEGLEKARIRNAAWTNRHNPEHLPYQRISPLNQVTAGGRFNCHESRDRVYAILALLDLNIRSKIEIDYNKPVEQVYTDFVEVVINTSHSLEALTLAGLCQGPSSCPSWVQDLSKLSLDKSNRPKGLRYAQYSASCLTRPNYSINRTKNEITTRGMAVDSILDTLTIEDHDILWDCQHRKKGAKGLHIWKQSFEEYPTACNPLHAWIKTITADMDGNALKADRQTPEVLEAYVNDYILYDSSKEELLLLMPVQETEKKEWIARMTDISYRFASATIAASVNRTFFISKSGYMGMGPRLLEKGDVICVMLGCNVPLLLRNCGDHYILVGECFVWGLMDGEVMRMKRKAEYWLDTFRVL